MPIIWGQLAIWLSACSVLIVVYVRQVVTKFSSTITGKPGCTTLLEHDIKITNAPVRAKQYPLLFNMMIATKDEVINMILGNEEPSEKSISFPCSHS